MKITLKHKYYKTKDGSIVVINHYHSPKNRGKVWNVFMDYPYAGRIFSESHLTKSGHMSGLWARDGKYMIRQGAKKHYLDIVKKSSKKAYKKYLSMVDKHNIETLRKYVVKVG